jgi:hypothetical protein
MRRHIRTLMHRPANAASFAAMEHSEVETARRRLEEARRVLDDGRDGASPCWMEAVQDYVNKCQEEYVRALERAQSRDPASPGDWSAPSDG